MKILKPGKVEMRKFVCPRCGCEFAAGRGEQDTRYQFHYKCPQDGCGWYVLDTGGEPYEEPTQNVKTNRDWYRRLVQEKNTNLFGGVSVTPKPWENSTGEQAGSQE